MSGVSDKERGHGAYEREDVSDDPHDEYEHANIDVEVCLVESPTSDEKYENDEYSRYAC